MNDVMCKEESVLFGKLRTRKRKLDYLYKHGKISREKYLKKLDVLSKEVDELENRFNKIYEETESV